MVTDLVSNHQAASFSHRVRARARAQGSWLCIGLDPQTDLLPSGLPRTTAGVVEFCRLIVDATAPYAACFKLNFAFFEALGTEGWNALAQVRASIPPSVPVIADAKRGDIPSTAIAYASAVFERLGFDAVTWNPYLGWDAIAPAAAYRGKCVFVLSRTSNPGARAIQDLSVDGEPLYLRVAREALAGTSEAEIGLVAGATDIQALSRVRSLSQSALLLVPGVGAQGAGAAAAVRAGGNGSGENALINASRSIIHASAAGDFADRARDAARRLAAETVGGKPNAGTGTA